MPSSFINHTASPFPLLSLFRGYRSNSHLFNEAKAEMSAAVAAAYFQADYNYEKNKGPLVSSQFQLSI